MERKKYGPVFILLSVTLLIVQLYCLPIIRYASRAAGGAVYVDLVQYIFHFPLNISFLLTLALLGTGIWMACGNDSK